MEKRNVTLFSILNLWTIVIILVNTIVISGLCYYQIATSSRQQTLEKFQQSFFQAHQSIDNYLKGMIIAASAFVVDGDLMANIDVAEQQSGIPVMFAQQEIRKSLIRTVNLNMYIRDIAIYKGNIVHRYNQQRGLYRIYRDMIPTESWFSELQEGKLDQALIPAYPMAEDMELYIYATAFQSLASQGSRGVIVLLMESSYFHNLVDDADIKDSSVVCLLDSDGRLLYSNKHDEALRLQNALLTSEKLQSGNSQWIGGVHYYVVKSQSDYSGWQLVSFTRSSVLYRDFYPIRPSLLLGILFVMLVSILIILLVFKTIARPLKELVLAMDSNLNRQFGEVYINSSYMEIQTISIALNNMNRQIAQHINSIRRNEKEKRLAELRLLEAQINPHFIYNTLDAIKWVALLNQAQVVAEMLASFVGLLQISLSAGEDSIPVRLEIEQLRHYVKIMQYRYNSYVQVHIDVEPDMLNLYTLKLILQPFVENCFFHAFEDTDDGIIQIRCRKENDCLLIEVQDNGIGLKAKSSESPKMLRGFGIQNVDERIKLYYGPGYGMEICSPKGGGTTVRIRQPLRQEKEVPNDTNLDSGG